jgi:hypothetical protein
MRRAGNAGGISPIICVLENGTMEKTIFYQVDAEEMVKAAMALSGWMGEKRNRAIIGLSVFTGFVFLCFILSFLSMGSNACALGPAFFMFSAIPLFLLYQLWYLPRRYRKIYEDQKTLGEQTVTIADEFVLFEGEYGRSKLPWTVFLQWKEAGDYLYFYQSRNFTNFIPKSKLDAETLDFIRGKLRENQTPVQPSRQTRTFRLFAALLVILVFVMYLVYSWYSAFSGL